MELELGLALPISAHFPTKTTYHLDQPQLKNNASLGLALEFKNLVMITQRQKQKRGFSQAFDDDDDEVDHDDDQESKTLSLLVWNGRRPNNHDDDDDEDGEGRRRKPFDTASKKDEDDNQIVGWPPIRSWRKKLLRGGGHGYRMGADQRAADNNNNNGGGGGRNSIFVKVKMEGVMIGRKIDLMLFNSYQALTNALLNMFAKYRKQGDKVADGPYILAYLDKDGDWLLAGDVPWQTFINSVQRMEILKRSN